MRSTSGGILYDQPIVNRLASSFWPIRAMLPTNISTFGCRTLGNPTARSSPRPPLAAGSKSQA